MSRLLDVEAGIITVDTELIAKFLALAMGLVLGLLLPAILGDRTHSHAIAEHLLPEQQADPAGHDKLERLFEWRDLIAAVLSGIFVLEFAAADKIASHDQVVAHIAYVVALGIVPIMLLTSFLLVSKLPVRKSPTKIGYWLAFSVMVLPWYLLAIALVACP
jgi:hypothetical protein